MSFQAYKSTSISLISRLIKPIYQPSFTIASFGVNLNICRSIKRFKSLLQINTQYFLIPYGLYL